MDIKSVFSQVGILVRVRITTAFSLFKTGLPALDVPQDHAFIAQINKFSQELGVKYIMNGYNICTEVVADPVSWFVGGVRLRILPT